MGDLTLIRRMAVLVAMVTALATITPAAEQPPVQAISASAPAATQPTVLTPGDHRRELKVDGKLRSYIIHIPPGYDPSKPSPVVLAFHGAWMNAKLMEQFCGLNIKADHENFIAIYPNGTGFGEALLFFNAWAAPAAAGIEGPVDDVRFTGKMLDDLAGIVNVDTKRVFATGMSNGGMMCHRLAAEMPDRIAAIAAVSGTVAAPDFHPKRPIPVMHFHGTADPVVPWAGQVKRKQFVRFESVDDTIKEWVEADGCPAEPKTTTYPDIAKDGTSVARKVYGPGKNGSEVVLIVITNGGHTWPGREPALTRLGKSTMNISANDLIWDFFLEHPMK